MSMKRSRVRLSTEEAHALVDKVITSGCGASFTALYAAYSDPIFKLINKRVGNIDNATEVSQEVWLKVWEKLPQFKGASTFWTWLNAVAKNLTTNYLVKSNRDVLRNAYVLDANEDLDWLRGTQDMADPMNLLIAVQAHEAIEYHVKRLSVGYKQAYRLREELSMDYVDIARELNITEAAARRRVSDARIIIAKHLEEDGYEPL